MPSPLLPPLPAFLSMPINGVVLHYFLISIQQNADCGEVMNFCIHDNLLDQVSDRTKSCMHFSVQIPMVFRLVVCFASAI